MSMGKSDDRLTTPQAAALLGVTTRTVQRWVGAGRIRAERITPPHTGAYLLLNREDVEQVRRDRGPRDRG